MTVIVNDSGASNEEIYDRLLRARGVLRNLQSAAAHHPDRVHVLPISNDSVGAVAAEVMNAHTDEFAWSLFSGVSRMIELVEQGMEDLR